MMWQSTLPLLILLSALVSGVAIFFVSDNKPILRKTLNFFGAGSCVGLILVMISGVYQGQVFETRLPLLPNMDLVLHADALSLLFVALSGFLWLLTTIYAIGYLEQSPNRSRFFGFFSLCVFATIGVALAGNLITFLIFYELLTLTTYPLVVHKGNKASLAAGRKYLIYTMLGGASLLAGVVWLKALAGSLDFTATGILASMPHLDPFHLKVIFALIIIGLGVKAALIPLHGWLPSAMAAPAPVSALLHAVAVVKAGAFGIVRVVYDVYGVEFAQELGLTIILAVMASVTIVYGSTRAVFQDDLKRRLAYSTVSQVSYIALGTAIAGPIATIGGIAHLVHQGLMKITMFFCAGSIAETLGVTKVSQMNGAGKRMPLTMLAFSLAVLGMIGIPPAAGFISKWYLGTGALEAGFYWVLGVLIISSLLNATYFLPILYAAWFKPQQGAWPKEKPKGRLETHWMLMLPPVVTALLALSAGLFADAQFSPLNWVKLIAAREYGSEFVSILAASSQQIPAMWLALGAPLLCALLLVRKQMQQVAHWFLPLSAGIALLAYAISGQGSNTTPWLFFGSVLTLNDTTSTFFLLAVSLWLLAAVFAVNFVKADERKVRFCLFFLLAMCGNFGLVLAQDISGFISFFTLMSLASYGLVVHFDTDEAHQAGKSYMQWAVLGELLLFTGLAGLAFGSIDPSLAGNPEQTYPAWVIGFLLAGFGVKAGLFGLHVWLPMAHPVAPVAASALLSGVMVKAGLLGWLKFIPFGEVAFATYGSVLVVLGLFAAFFGVLVGVTQDNPKALLAYSTMSQMGILIAAVGVGLKYPELWSLLLPAIVLYAVHHGLAKAALFLFAGMNSTLTWHKYRWVCWLAAALPAAALAGLPLTSGAVAKIALKDVVERDLLMGTVLPLTATGTTWLMMRFLQLIAQKQPKKVTGQPDVLQLGAYGTLLILVTVLSYLISQANGTWANHLTAASFWSSAWPVLLGLGIYFITRALPAGDINVAYTEAGSLVRLGAETLSQGLKLLKDEIENTSWQLPQRVVCRQARVVGLAMAAVRSLMTPGVLFALLLCMLLLAMIAAR
ncbi:MULTISPECIES: proton-conducting transporter membrane subunit [unclassified Pseudoalteromonas]|uniref:complex I subunit 5 family protein n=1 Tax=unclassified Pseudoalteromonas TaxID=194690 RepID=UPI00209771ED|nr:proton-conducting transporter membrane subunit [Pseudoalteromonas sp. XMcav2-N]MCO7187986.1 sodium:proton antiporter [Pseudoalteromonas sp. XMcav2-N]